MHSHLVTIVAALFLSQAAAAQFAGPGISWAGTSGTGTRSFVPNCTNTPVPARPGETVTLTVWGDVLAPFGLFAAASGTQCLPVPGLGNGLILDFPVLTVAFGVLSQTTPCLSCPPGLEPMTFMIPPNTPPGTSISFQAASLGNGNPAFTAAITGSV
jgi:hypothetical protein